MKYALVLSIGGRSLWENCWRSSRNRWKLCQPTNEQHGLIVGLFAKLHRNGAQVAINLGQRLLGAAQEQRLEFLQADLPLFGVEHLGKPVGNNREQISRQQGKVRDLEALVLEEANGNVGVGVLDDGLGLRLIMQDRQVASERKGKVVGSVATHIGEGEIVCRRGEGLHHIVQIREEFCRLLQFGQLHGRRALGHGHEYARGYAMARNVCYISVPASVALHNIKEVATHLAAGDGSSKQLY